MDSIIPLLLLALSSVRSEPLPEAVQRRSDKGVYASEYAREYEPMTFAAVPLHSPIPLRAPIPVFHVLSPAPAQPPAPAVPRAPRPAPSAQRPIYALPPQQYEAYRYARPYRYAQQFASNQPYAASQTYAVSRPYASSYGGSYVMYADDVDESAPTVLYARPTPDGGYTYRRRPTRKRPPTKRQPPASNEPVLIRVHKYRIIRDR